MHRDLDALTLEWVGDVAPGALKVLLRAFGSCVLAVFDFVNTPAPSRLGCREIHLATVGIEETAQSDAPGRQLFAVVCKATLATTSALVLDQPVTVCVDGVFASFCVLVSPSVFSTGPAMFERLKGSCAPFVVGNRGGFALFLHLALFNKLRLFGVLLRLEKEGGHVSSAAALFCGL